MSQINILDLKGQEVSKAKLSEAIFGLKENDKLIHQSVVAQLANARQANAHTKTRGEVRGGGAKPWKQKGTGRARAGSSNSPVWVGGGTVFGPRNDRNYSLMINKKMKRKALFMALSDKVAGKKMIVVDKLDIKEPKTKALIEILDNLPTSDGTVLIILDDSNPNIELAARNIPYVKLIKISSLNIIDILKFNYILTTKSGLEAIETHFAQTPEEKINITKEEIESENNEVKAENKEEKTEKPAKKTAKTPTKDKKEGE